MPLLSAAALSVVAGAQFEIHTLLLNIICMAVPFVVLRLWRKRLDADVEFLNVCVYAGLMTAALGWTWVTIDGLVHPSAIGSGTSVLAWLIPTMLVAMFASDRLDRAVAL